MQRFALLVVGLALAAATGCAQCDTCDDFPAPCTGPNCGQNGYDVNGFVPPTQDGLPQGAAMTPATVGTPAASMNGGSPDMPSATTPPAIDPAGNTPPLPNNP